MWAELASLRDAINTLDTVETCKVGIEANISPNDYPMVRIVPERLTPGQPYQNRTVEVGIYFGVNINDSEGLQMVYENLSMLEGEIVAVIKEQGGKFIETITDEDRLDTYKLMFIRCEINAVRPSAPV